MGKSQRDKGKRFEREIARQYRAALPHYADEIERGQQGGGATRPDVCVPGLWIECNHSKTPLRRIRGPKLQQAIGDADAAGRPVDVPVAVTREHGTSTTWATLTLGDLVEVVDELRAYGATLADAGLWPVKVSLSHESWLVLWTALDARRREDG